MKDYTDDELVDLAGNLDAPARSEAHVEITRRLKESIERGQEATNGLNESLLKLTKWIVVLTVVIVILTS